MKIYSKGSPRTGDYDPTALQEDFYFSNRGNTPAAIDMLRQSAPARATYERCRKDPVFFITTFCGLERRSAMTEVVMGLEEKRRIVVKHPRQIGITTTAIAYALWKAIFQPNSTILFATINSFMASAAHFRFGQLYDALPGWLKPGVHHHNRHLFNLVNSSVVTFTACSERMATGQHLDLLILDSFAMNQEQLKEAVWFMNLPTISRGGQLLVASTPCGTHDLFTEIWKQAKAGHSFLHPIDLAFWQLPEPVQDHFRRIRLSLGAAAFWRECLGNLAEDLNAERLENLSR